MHYTLQEKENREAWKYKHNWKLIPQYHNIWLSVKLDVTYILSPKEIFIYLPSSDLYSFLSIFFSKISEINLLYKPSKTSILQKR